jgi:hypothetical protein
MPRIRKAKCPSRTTAASKLDAVLEFNLTEWLGLPIEGMALEFDQMEEAWQQHREIILAEWISQLPGSRPFGAYASEEIPLPQILRKPYESDVPYSSRSEVIHNYLCYFEDQESEFEYLQTLDVMPAAEVKAAKARFNEYEDWQHYRSSFGPTREVVGY